MKLEIEKLGLEFFSKGNDSLSPISKQVSLIKRKHNIQKTHEKLKIKIPTRLARIPRLNRLKN